jgi:hypothetical protein
MKTKKESQGDMAISHGSLLGLLLLDLHVK